MQRTQRQSDGGPRCIGASRSAEMRWPGRAALCGALPAARYFFGLPSPAASRHIARSCSSAMAAQRPAESLTAGPSGLPVAPVPVPVPVPVRGVVRAASGGVLPNGMVSCGVIVRSGRNSPGGAADSRFSAAVSGRVWRLTGTGADAAGLTTSTGAEAGCAPLATGLAVTAAGVAPTGADFTVVAAVWAPAPAAAPASHKAASRGNFRIVMALILARIGTGQAPASRRAGSRLIADNRP